MQVDVPPWVSQWLSVAEWRRRQRERDRRMPGLTLYAYGPYGRDPPNPAKPIYRINGYPEERDGVLGPRYGDSAGQRPGPGQAQGLNTAGGWVPLHYPLDPFVAHKPNGVNQYGMSPQRVNVEWLPPAVTPRAPRALVDDGVLSGRAALRAWVFGSALVVLVLVLVRAIDKCLTVNLFNPAERRRAREWPTPNVRAVRGPESDISTVIIPDYSDEPGPPQYSDVSRRVRDRPPPYFETADGSGPSATGQKLPPAYGGPPPAYSDTFVEFSNKRGFPSVLIFSRRRKSRVNRQEVAASGSGAVDDGPTSSQQNAQNNDTEINGATTSQQEEQLQEDINNETRCRESNTNNASEIEPSNDNNASSCHTADNIETVDVHSPPAIKSSTTDTNGGLVASSKPATGNVGDEENTKEREIMV